MTKNVESELSEDGEEKILLTRQKGEGEEYIFSSMQVMTAILPRSFRLMLRNDDITVPITVEEKLPTLQII